MNVPDERRYAASHEWVLVESDLATIGITDHAQEELGDIVYLELPEPGRILARGEAFGVVESVKAVSDLYSPVSGEVVEVNATLPDATDLINTDPYGEAWMLRIRMSKPGEAESLMNAAAYRSTLAG